MSLTDEQKRAKNREYQKRWVKKNAAKKKGQQKKWRDENATQRQMYRRKYYAANKDRWRKKRAENREREANRRLLRSYGVTLDEFKEKLKAQEGCCKICQQPFRNSKDTQLDHCHKTGTVRSLLCSACNVGLARFKDSEELLERAQEYLRSFR